MCPKFGGAFSQWPLSGSLKILGLPNSKSPHHFMDLISLPEKGLGPRSTHLSPTFLKEKPLLGFLVVQGPTLSHYLPAGVLLWPVTRPNSQGS